MANRSETTRRKRGDDESSAVAFPSWVMFEPYDTRDVQGCTSIADTKTTADGYSTTGLPVTVSLCLMEPSEVSRVRVQHPAGVRQYDPTLLAAHGDSVLVKVDLIGEDPKVGSFDYFVYNAGDATAVNPSRPPSLSLVPAFHITDESARERPDILFSFSKNITGGWGNRMRGNLEPDGTGLLRRGKDEFVVAALKMEYVRGTTRMVAELRLFRSGVWRVTQPPIRHFGGECGDLASTWQNHVVIPVGDQLLCWVDLSRGLLFSKVFDESPELRYVPLPVDSEFVQSSCRNVCVTAGGGTVKFVNIIPRCCCGGEGVSYCPHSRRAYTVHTWTLRMADDDMTWVMDGVLDASQLWALDGYRGLPRLELDYPVASMDDPHAICFTMCGSIHDYEGGGDTTTVWRIMVDMRSKTLQSATSYPGRIITRKHFIPSRVSNYFNSIPIPSSSGEPGPALAERNLSSKKIKLETSNSTGEPAVQPPCELSTEPTQAMKAASHEATILAALEEIPALDCDDMLKAYRILSHDDSGRRFRSLMGLPMNLRKDCVLMDIRASEACILCSACTAELQQQA